MKNVLILASGYCGKATANGLCAKALVKELEKNDVCVHVVSCDAEKVENNPHSRVISIQRLSVKKVDTPKNTIVKIFRLLKNIVFNIWTPKYDKNMTAKMFDTAMTICSQAPIDAVICMYFPVEAIAAGYELKKIYPKVEFMIYELDSVSDGIAGGNKWNKHLLFSYKRFLGHIYKKADLLMILNCHERHWLKEYKPHKEKMKLVDLPILQKTNVPVCECASASVKFIYSGALDHSYRSPETMLEAFKHIDANINWELEFYSKGCESTLRSACEHDKQITCHGYVEQSELQCAISKAHILLSIGNKVSNSLPSKVITYMSYGKPIIHFCLKENDICEEYFNKYPLSLVIKKGERPLVAARKIVEFVEMNCGKTISFEDLCKELPMNLPSYSTNIILDVLNKKDNGNGE